MNDGIYGASLHALIEDAAVYDSDFHLGDDIEEANAELFAARCPEQTRAIFLKWAARFQPCLFGRIGARRANGVSYELEVITRDDIERGDIYLLNKMQAIRRAWKQKALLGQSSALLILFKHERLARAEPGEAMLQLCRKIADLYFIEHAPTRADVIYTEAIPLHTEQGVGLFKAGVNVFYGGAHGTLNHDRRIPGGMLISVNSPGHLANTLVVNGFQPTLDAAVRWVFETAMHSVGNGGMAGHGRSATWHNTVDDISTRNLACPLRRCPAHIPENYDGKTYSAHYHTDVLVPSAATLTTPATLDYDTAEIWRHLSLDYISEKTESGQALDEWFFPETINEEALYHNPWPPLKAVNSPTFAY